jgi:hypothetical protein
MLDVAVFTQPFASVPDTVNVVFAVAIDVTVAPVLLNKEAAGDHVYDVPPVAVKTPTPQKLPLFAAVAAIVGSGFTVTTTSFETDVTAEFVHVDANT